MVDIRYYSVQQASEVLGVDAETILAHIHSGELAAVNVCKSRNAKRPTWRIGEADLGRFILSRRSQVSQPAPQVQKRKPPKQFV